MSQTAGIYDLKQVQQNQNGINIFKNHDRIYLKLRPVNQKNSYSAGDRFEYQLKGQGVDYINFNGSCLFIKINYQRSANLDNAVLPRGTLGVIYRFENYIGEYPLVDITNYQEFMWMNWLGSSTENSDIQYESGIRSRVAPNSTAWLKVPLMTLYDTCGYFPVYNLAEKFRFIFTVGDYKNWFLRPPVNGLGNEFVNEITGDNQCTAPYISDTYWLIDGLIARSGAVLTMSPYRFHSLNTLGVKRTFNGGGLNNFKFSYDIKKTSLKGVLSGLKNPLTIDYRNIVVAGQNIHQIIAQTSYLGNGLDYCWWSMGGIYYPFRQRINFPYEMWFQFQKFFHLYDSIGTFDNHKIKFLSNWSTSVTWDNHADYTFYAFVFDRLDQTANVISGIDTERYDTQLELTYQNVLNASYDLYTFFVYDVIVTVIGGEIKIED